MYYTLDFIEWDAKTISLYQQTCKANREWRSEELGVMTDEWWEEWWKMIEENLGKEETEKMKEERRGKRLICLKVKEESAAKH